MRICLKIKWTYNCIIYFTSFNCYLATPWSTFSHQWKHVLSQLHLQVEFLNPVKQPVGFELAAYQFNTFQPSVEIHIETSDLICTTSQLTSFHMKWNTGLKWVENALIKNTFLQSIFQNITQYLCFLTSKNLTFSFWVLARN